MACDMPGQVRGRRGLATGQNESRPNPPEAGCRRGEKEPHLMAVEKIYAQLSCSDLSSSVAWFQRIFGRPPDARPMDGLAEWHHHDHAGFQLFEDRSSAGHGTLTLIVSGLADEHSRLTKCGLEPPDIEPADSVSLIRLHDPDQNLVVLAQPGRA
jgi:hypothetical protein